MEITLWNSRIGNGAFKKKGTLKIFNQRPVEKEGEREVLWNLLTGNIAASFTTNNTSTHV